MWRKWIVLWSLWAARLTRQPTTPVRVASGLLRGSIAHDGTHVHYLAIPYATVGERFQAPLPAPKWDGIRDFYEENVRCIQRYTKTSISGREDCLTLNVYTPLQRAGSLRPVMVFFHGGGFRDGSGSRLLYGPEYLVTHDVILVTINYRVEILGFLCLHIEEAPGNAGLKDQLAALRWVRDNINAFGGDPDNVTIFGESAGSASVMYHLLSPMSRGLYQKAIMQSGSAMSPWAFQFEPLKIASNLAKHFGYNTEDPKEIYKLFVNKTGEELLRTRVPRAEGDIVLSENIFVPCAEKTLPGVKPFLTDTPYNLISKGFYNKVPVIIGFNNEEGYMFAGKENETTIAYLDFYKALPRDLVIPSEEEIVRLSRQLKQLYMGEDDISKDTIAKFSRFEGETSITYPVIATVGLFMKNSHTPLYVYKFSHDGWMNLIKLYFGFWTHPGATHADELFYLFKPRIRLIMSFFEGDMVNKMTRMWTNFAKFGNPTPASSPLAPPLKWEPATNKSPNLLVIDKNFSMEPIWRKESILFWNTTYSKFRRKV